MALVFALQSIGLFIAPARVAPAVAEAAEPAMTMADCPHHHPQGKGHDHGRSDTCPMCQTLGCALPGASLPTLVGRAEERLIGQLALPAPRFAPRAPPLQTPPARGPPVVV